MFMKNILKIALIYFLLISTVNYSQVSGISNSNGTNYEMVFIPRDKEDTSKEFEKIAQKMYLTQAYIPSKIDDFKDDIYLRYNIYKDEMEFINNDKVLYLKKEIGRKIHFINLNINYEVFNHNGKLVYFQVMNKNGAKLLCKQNIEFQQYKPAETSYQKDRPADFNRKDDSFFIQLKEDIIELPSNNKKFFNLLDSSDSKLKKFTSENKLNIKNKEDLLKIINFYNSM